VRVSGIWIGIACTAVALAAGSPARAQLNRTAVSVYGNDANNCAVATPCRSFARAITQTNAGGEVVALDSAGFGPFVADRSITVQAAPGVHAGVTATAGDAISINAGASGKVVLRGLVVNGMGTASAGIAFTGSGAEVQVENCVVTNFAGWGIIAWFPIRIQDTIVRESGTGISIDNGGAPVNATLERVQLQSNTGPGLLAWRNAKVAVRDSVAALNATGFLAQGGGVLSIENGLATENGTGIAAAGGTVRISNTTVVANTTGVSAGGGTVESWQNNRIRGNTPDLTGSLTNIGLK
jgi:hypothetical protein